MKIFTQIMFSCFHSLASFFLSAVLVMFSFAISATLHALEFKTSGGTLSGGFDTTISTGAAWRVEERDEDLVGSYNGGKAPHVNGDDGNLNYDRGIVSQVSKVIHELDLHYRNYSFFGRMNYFYDAVNAN